MTPCQHCGKDTPDEAFCTWCGAHRTLGQADAARTRRHEYAAHSGEHVAQPSVITTLFPHLPRHLVHEFRLALLAGLAVVVGLVGGGLIVEAILAAAVLVPALYLVYLYEAQVYRDEPAKTLGLTMVSGAALGVVVSIVADVVLHDTSPLQLTPSIGFLVASAVILPVVQEAVKVLPVLVLRRSAKFGETIDGLTFGVAAGLGFAAAETIVQFSKVITTEPVHIQSASWLFPVLSVTIMKPLLEGSCTGLLAAALWKPRRLGRPLYALGIPFAFGGHIVYSFVSQLLEDHGVDWATIVFFQAAVVGVMLVYIRHVVHDALLDEAGDIGFQTVRCPHCHRTVGAAGFCPLCGGSVTAGPRPVPAPVPARAVTDAMVVDGAEGATNA